MSCASLRAPKDSAKRSSTTLETTVVLIDNYDSFTYNLYQYLRLVVFDVRVYRNDQIEIGQLRDLRPLGIVISPGPKAPKDAGISKEIIRVMGPTCPTFGVCLGHQAINEVFGGATIRAPKPWHGKTSAIIHDGQGVFAGLPQNFRAARYHSLVADRERIAAELEVTAQTDDGLVMGLRHREFPMEGVQFHPESFLTEHGHAMIQNFLERAEAWQRTRR
jgi:anthranilate synthase component II